MYRPQDLRYVAASAWEGIRRSAGIGGEGAASGKRWDPGVGGGVPKLLRPAGG